MSANIAAIYCRLSKEDELKITDGDESESIQNQKLLLMDYAMKNGFIVQSIYTDENFNGFCERPGFNQMLEDAEHGKFNIILCKHQSRFSRDISVVEKYIHGIFVEQGIRFISITDNVDTKVHGNKKARQINGLINEWYSEDLSINIRTVFRKKMEDGQFIGSFAPYGYEKDPNDHHKLIVDEEAAEVVREIFDLYHNGNGIWKIAQILTERKIPTPAQHKRNNGSSHKIPMKTTHSIELGIWSECSVRTILGNEIYIGSLAQGKRRKVSYKNDKKVKNARSEWVVIDNNHEPIVSERIFNSAQSLLESKRSGKVTSANKTESKPHLLAGKVFCADCGSMMKRTKSVNGDYYLRCSLATKSRGAKCTSHYTNQEKVEVRLFDLLQRIVEGKLKVTSQTVKDEDGNVVTDIKKFYDRKRKELDEINDKIKAYDKALSVAYLDKVTEVITVEQFMEFSRIYEEEKKPCIEQRDVLAEKLEEYNRRIRMQSDLQKRIEKHKHFDTLTHEIINDFIERIHFEQADPRTKEPKFSIEWIF